MIVVAVALTSLVAAVEPSWSSTLLPAPEAVIDITAGGGAAWTPQSGLEIPVSPEVVVGARWGITDNVQLAFPLLVTGSFDVDVGPYAGVPLVPRLALTTGLAGVGYSSVDGVLFVPALAGTVSLVGNRSALMLTVDASVLTTTGNIDTTAFGVVGGFAFKLDDRWSVGFQAHASQSHSDRNDVVRDTATIGVGSKGGGIPVDVPTVRLLLTRAWSAELWVFADYAIATTFVGPVDMGATASVTYRFGY